VSVVFTNEEMALTIINTLLKWDGSHLGHFSKDVIVSHWLLENTSYYGINLPEGIVYCNANRTKDAFPCIVEDIKSIFEIPRRGVHRINIGGWEYVLYYVPISLQGEVIWETPLNRLDSKHLLRKDPYFRKSVQRIIAFCDILALSSTGEPTIRIRPGIGGQFIPINCNESATMIAKSVDYDFSVLSKTIFSKWFGEETVIGDIVKEMIHYQNPQKWIGEMSPDQRYVETIKDFLPNMNGNKIQEPTTKMTVICSSIRSRIDEIIKQYDANYSWYSCFIIDRMSRYLLND
jgi:hypothetical protein